ncbi:hypothetical protein LJC14_01110 [Treponema sp. OttesenSCG-928-L16]|nr:hypothetical protein [Treponema sp. OttesenSCG-928-L16]
MEMIDAALLTVLLPLCGALFSLAAKIQHSEGRGRFLEWTGALIGLFLPLGLLFVLLPQVRAGALVFAVGNRPSFLGIMQCFDGLAWLLDLLGFSALCIAWLYSRGAGPRGGLFTTLFLIQASALAAAASCTDLFNLFICFEVLGIASYALVAISGKAKALLASFSYLAVSSASMTFFLLGVYGLYRITGSLSYEGIYQALSVLPGAGGTGALLSLCCIIAATMVRVAVFPLYGWLPDAHGAAPHAVSAVLSGVLLKTPLFALGRFLIGFSAPSFSAFPAAVLWEILGVAGVVTALIGVVFAVSQRDVKRLLAYHSVSQIGYVISAWALASPEGLAAAWMHAFFHAIFKGLLFLSVGSAADAGGSRNVYTLRNAAALLRKAGDRYNITAVSFMTAALSIAAVPPFSGYASKNGISYLFGSSRWQYWALALAGIGTMASMIKLSAVFFNAPVHGAPVRGQANAEAGDTDASMAGEFRVRRSMKIAMGASALLCLVLGICAKPFGIFAAALCGAEKSPVPESLFSIPSIGNALIYAAAAIGVYFFIMSRPGMNLSGKIRSLPRDFSYLMLAFPAALAALYFFVFLWRFF